MSLLKEVGIAPIGDKYKEQWKALGAWFLGPRGENSGVFVDCFKMMVSEHVHYRNSCFPADPAYITQDIKISNAFQCEIHSFWLLEMLFFGTPKTSDLNPIFCVRCRGFGT